jgi:transposase
MNKEQEEQKTHKIMDFRYSIIAELLNPYLSRSERRAMMREKAGRRYEIPYSNRTRLTVECIKKWYATFKRFGKEGLRPKQRSDKGICRALSAEETAAFLEYLEHNPELTAKAAYRKLRDEGVIHTGISKSALSRLVLSAGLQRKARMHSKDQRQQLKFAFKYPLECDDPAADSG